MTPCKPGEQGSVQGNWMSFPKEQVDIGIITKDDLENALKRTKPSVDSTQLKEYEEFTSTFGQDGWWNDINVILIKYTNPTDKSTIQCRVDYQSKIAMVYIIIFSIPFT